MILDNRILPTMYAQKLVALVEFPEEYEDDDEIVGHMAIYKDEKNNTYYLEYELFNEEFEDETEMNPIIIKIDGSDILNNFYEIFNELITTNKHFVKYNFGEEMRIFKNLTTYHIENDEPYD